MKRDDRFKEHPIRPEEIQGHLLGARKKLKAANKIMGDDEESAYELAYEAMLKASLALILSDGKRPRSLPGHHIAIIEKAGQLLGSEVADLIRAFEEMRRHRNSFLYTGQSFVSLQEAKECLNLAADYVCRVEKKLKS